MKRGQQMYQICEDLRQRDFADLDPELVRELLSLQVEFQEDRLEARRRTEKKIAEWVAAHTDNPPSGAGQ